MREEREMWDRVIHGDCLEVMRGMPDCSFDACVVDPPYGFGEVKDIAGLLQAWMQDEDDSHYLGKGGFMNAQWDSGVPGPRYWREVYRVLKPGSHIVAFSSTRTYDLLVIALRLANFQIKDTIIWCHGQGFPKSLNLGNGRGTALKPAIEPICLARKPLSEPTIASNVLRWNGCGALNIDQCRVSSQGDILGRNNKPGENGWKNSSGGPSRAMSDPVAASKRFPSNLLLSHDPRCIARGTKRIKGDHKAGQLIRGKQPDPYGFVTPHVNDRHTDEHGLEEVPAFECVENCPVRVLGEQSGDRNSHGTAKRATYGGIFGNGKPVTGPIREGDTGSAARYFQQFHDPLETLDAPFHYFSKASKRERDAGLEGMPTSKKIGTYDERPSGNFHERLDRNKQLYRLCDDLTPEQRAYVEQELAKIGGVI